ncbi:GNAT family N-acetyltransferase [Arthrobacter sp. ZGTC412]|uniref:GNAT family N-acetyltransferase n=1 Tax=Arthrobacter sp. ZGTC412 TaxID=2058900 RepID=UPI000CE2CDD9|nr:GNAT family N-acetyltransferase [Arthrobacter sp. ZGTC412]
MEPGDWSLARSIYQEGIDAGHATFESSAPDWESFDQSRLPKHRHVAASADGTALGWAAVSPVSSRRVYAGVVEHSVYVASAARGLGIGTALLQALIASTERDGIWTIQASVFPENDASLKLHLANGFTIVGRRQRIARMTHGPLIGKWRDTLLIERRSDRI